MLTAVTSRYKLKFLTVNKAQLNRQMSKLDPDIDNLSLRHQSGIYRTEKSKEKYYFFQDPNLDPPHLPNAYSVDVWKDISSRDSQQLKLYLDSLSRINSLCPNPKKRKLDEIDMMDNYHQLKESTIEIAKLHSSRKVEDQYCSYWSSPEAMALFRPKNGESVTRCLVRRHDLLLRAMINDEVLSSICDMPDQSYNLSSKQREYIRIQAIYLAKSYELALQKMNEVTWTESINAAIEEVNDMGISNISTDRTIREWNCLFRIKEQFRVPYYHNDKEPKLFEFEPSTKEQFLHYCNSMIKSGELSTESARTELVNVISPKCYASLVSELGESDRNNHQTYDEFLKFMGLRSISMNTTWRWMHHLGLSYDENRRCYYTDGHERPDVVDDRDNRFLDVYFNYEIRTHRWVQITDSVATELEKSMKQFPLNCYHSYIHDDIPHREYHVDCHPCLHKYINSECLIYGGNLSVRKDPATRPLMLVGQDESTYHQYIFSKKYWKVKGGTNFILPKQQGDSLMISGYQSREFGLGLGSMLTTEMRNKINFARRGKKYNSADDAELILGSSYKGDLEDDPTLRFFSAGANREGYWSNSHAKIQLEDVYDVLSIIFPDFDFIFLFDQSSGHKKYREDSLNIKNINVSYGGKNTRMRDTVIKEVGPYPAMLKVGETQKMCFTEEDEGPFWLTPENGYCLSMTSCQIRRR